MKKKTRRFDEGGFLSKEGENEAISKDSSTRERARKFVEDKEESIAPKATSKASTPTVKASSTKSAPKAEPKEESKPKAETKEEYTSRMEGLTKKQALENVSPEDYIPGGGMLKAGLKAIVGAGARRAAKEAAETGAKEGVKQLENNATKRITYDKASDLAKKRTARAEARDTEMKRGNARNYGIDPDNASQSVYDSLRKNIGDGKFSMKKGGFVHHSEHVKKHSAGFKNHDDHIKSMCMGGKTRSK